MKKRLKIVNTTPKKGSIVLVGRRGASYHHVQAGSLAEVMTASNGRIKVVGPGAKGTVFEGKHPRQSMFPSWVKVVEEIENV